MNYVSKTVPDTFSDDLPNKDSFSILETPYQRLWSVLSTENQDCKQK